MIKYVVTLWHDSEIRTPKSEAWSEKEIEEYLFKQTADGHAPIFTSDSEEAARAVFEKEKQNCYTGSGGGQGALHFITADSLQLEEWELDENGELEYGGVLDIYIKPYAPR